MAEKPDEEVTKPTSDGGGTGNGSSGGSGTEKPTGDEPQGLDKILASLDEDGRKAVRSELERARNDAAKYRNRAKDFDGIDAERAKQALQKLDEIENAAKSETERATERAGKAETERDSARKELWRERAGRKHGLSDAFTAMLSGDDQEAIEAHAKAIADELEGIKKRPGDSVPGTPKNGQAPGATDSEPLDYKKIAAEALQGY